mgnify:FL=1
MGLDMYLRKKTMVNSFWLNTPAIKEAGIKPKITITDIPGIDEDKIVQIVEEAAYWRKCNAVHKWFVDNVQDGEDDCAEYEMHDEKLLELVNLCTDIYDFYLKNRDNHNAPNKAAQEYAEGKLPCSEGFFFGGQDYNKYYFEEEIKYTIDALAPVLKCLDEEGFLPTYYVYSSSW